MPKHLNGGLAARLRVASSVLEIDTRLLAMLGALAAVWIIFDISTHGIFLSPRNLWNLSVQTSVTAMLATGMVLIIVSRNIDLSIGSLMAFLGIFGAFLQTEVLPLEGTHSWWISILAMVITGALCGGLQGWLSAAFSIPSFVVTLGGLMFWRSAGWLFTQGRTVTPLDTTYSIFGGGSIGEFWSWMVGLLGFAMFCVLAVRRRRRKESLGFKVKPILIEFLVVLAAGAFIALFVRTMNAYTYPKSEIGRGIPLPVLIVIVVACMMAYIARMTRFGRYIYGFGGNPEAAQLAGIATKRLVVASFALLGALTAIAGVISTARLNAAPLALGQLLELQVIAAAVIGGTSLAGGSGTILGAVIGAILMQSLQNGMVLLGVESAPQQMIMAGVLILAVLLDVTYQKRRK